MNVLVLNVTWSTFTVAGFWALSDIHKWSGGLQLALEDWDKQSASWKLPLDSPMTPGTNLTTFCGVFSTERHHLMLFGLVQWFPTAPDQPPLCKHLWDWLGQKKNYRQFR